MLTSCHRDRLLIVEAAINGSRTTRECPTVPVSAEEIERCILACVAAGASIIHAHAGEAVVGSSGAHDATSYVQPFGAVKRRHPSLFMYPTLPGGGPGTTMQKRLFHVNALALQGLVRIIPVDPGTMNYGAIDSAGRPPIHDAVYQTTFKDVDWAFAYCRAAHLACTMSIFEPGFLRLVDAHDRAGSLPQRSIVKLEFSAGARLFGLPPTAEAIDLCLTMFDSARIPWMVTLREGDCTEALATLAIERGGHVRVGIEDSGSASPLSNEGLVARVVDIGRALGRQPALPDDVPDVLAAARSDMSSSGRSAGSPHRRHP